MAMYDASGESGGAYWNYDQTPQNYGPTDPPARSANPDMQYLGTGNPWENTPEGLAAINKQYGGAQGGQSAQSWLEQYQNGNNASEGLDRTLQGLKASGYYAANFMYGN